eukprot:CAMPEP_0172824946 /NCGR_PEP_ID=MMETSP1075-20121228/18338_1 /TAXON_ID=2916 /ORGANISM="Ceratium fusus, Strain PA161109" /LENGTH=1083 /DNA_ID=CAMNT_0013666309 /DNA_START=15 /DNA_END=3267 /DNA_ORIENTATION=-
MIPGQSPCSDREHAVDSRAPKVPRLPLLNSSSPAQQAHEKLMRVKSDSSIRTPKRLLSDASSEASSKNKPSLAGTSDVSTVAGGVGCVTLQNFYDDVNWDDLVFHSPQGKQLPGKQAPNRVALSIYDATPKAAGTDTTNGWFIERQSSAQKKKQEEEQGRVPKQHEHQQQVPRQPLQQQPPLQLLSGSLRSPAASDSHVSLQTSLEQQVLNLPKNHMPLTKEALHNDSGLFRHSLIQEHQQQPQQQPQLLSQQCSGKSVAPLRPSTGERRESDKATPPPRLQQERESVREETGKGQLSTAGIEVHEQPQQRPPPKQSRGRHISWGDEEIRRQEQQDLPERPQEQSFLQQPHTRETEPVAAAPPMQQAIMTAASSFTRHVAVGTPGQDTALATRTAEERGMPARATAAGSSDGATQTEDSPADEYLGRAVTRTDSGGSFGSSSPSGNQSLTIRGQIPSGRACRTAQLVPGPAAEPVAVAWDALQAHHQQQAVASGASSGFRGPAKSTDQAFGLESPVPRSASPPVPMLDDVCEEGEMAAAAAEAAHNTSNSCLATSSEAWSSTLEPSAARGPLSPESEHDGDTGEDPAGSATLAPWPSSSREPLHSSFKGCRASAGSSKAQSWGSSGRLSSPCSPTVAHRTLLVKPVEEWDEKDVAAWISKISTVHGDFVELLHSHAISGAILLTLSEKDMLEMGIEKFGYRRLLLLAAQELREVLNRQKGIGTDIPPEPETVPNGTGVRSPVSGFRILQSTGQSASVPVLNMHPLQQMPAPQQMPMVGSAPVMDPRISLGTSSASSSIQIDGHVPPPSIPNMQPPGMVPIGGCMIPCQVPVVKMTSPILGHRTINLGARGTSPQLFAPAPVSQKGPCVPANQPLPAWMSPFVAVPVAPSSSSRGGPGGTRGRLSVLEDEVKAIASHLKATCGDFGTEPTASSTTTSVRRDDFSSSRTGSAMVPASHPQIPVRSPAAGSPMAARRGTSGEPPSVSTKPGRQFRRERTDPPQASAQQSSVIVPSGILSQGGQQVRHFRREWSDPAHLLPGAGGIEPTARAPDSSVRPVVAGAWHAMLVLALAVRSLGIGTFVTQG